MWVLAAAVLVPVVRLARGPSEAAYLAITARAAQVSGVHVVAEAGVLLLVALFVVAAWRARAHGPGTVAVALAGGFGAVLAYAVSEGTKLVVRQPRGCWELVEVAHCPPAGDWSFPSNHTTIAFALAAAVVATSASTGLRVRAADVPSRHGRAARKNALWSLALVALPVALACVTGAARVVQGVHLPHDVVAGAVLGVCTVAATILALGGPATTAVHAACRVPVLRQALTARPY